MEFSDSGVLAAAMITNKRGGSSGGGVREGSRWNGILGTPLRAVLGAGLTETRLQN